MPKFIFQVYKEEPTTIDDLYDDLRDSGYTVKSIKTYEEQVNVSSELKRLQRYDEELSKVMPEDYKDWWQNSKEEWPLVARYSIESLREREEWALDTLSQVVEHKTA